MKEFDVVLVTQKEYINPVNRDWYHLQILEEDDLVLAELAALGLKARRVAWCDKTFDWNSTKTAVIRATWDYFHRIDEFRAWLKQAQESTTVFNRSHILWWNLDKVYLKELGEKGIHIPPTVFEQKGSTTPVSTIMKANHWQEAVIKPNIGGGGRHTHKVNADNLQEIEPLFAELLSQEDMMVQEFQQAVVDEGEVSIMMFGSTYSHAILKRAKKGDFRVQDDFGGSVSVYHPSLEEKQFALDVIQSMDEPPLYARVDYFKDNNGKLALSELELIEPELWFREHREASAIFARELFRRLSNLQVQ